MRPCILWTVMILSSARPCFAEDCTPQTYTDPAKEPNYDCPSPQENVLVPDTQAQPSVEVKKGDAAPQSGILMDKTRVINLGLRIKALRHIRWIETTAAAKKLSAEIAYQQKVAQAKDDLLKSQVESYKKQYTDTRDELLKERKWYKSWSFGLVVGIVVTSAAATAIAVAATR